MSGYYIKNETTRSQVIRLTRGGAIVLRPKGSGASDTVFIASDSAEDQGVMSALFRGVVSKVTNSGVEKKKTEAATERQSKSEAAKDAALLTLETPVDPIVQVQCAGVKSDGSPCKSKVSVLESVSGEPQYCTRHAAQADAIKE